MKRSAIALCLGSCAFAAVGCSEESPSLSSQRPFRDDWQTEVTIRFNYLADNQPQIRNLRVGGGGYNDNFENQGDVIVSFTGEEDVLTVEFRRFTTASSEASAQEDFDNIRLWAYNTNTDRPLPPDDMSPEDNCATDVWLDGCAILAYYDGQTQLNRAGADIRVTLPPNYLDTVEIVTGDNLADDDYHNRGDVCVENLNGTVDIEMESGNAWISLADTVTEMPVCEFLEGNDITSCTEYVDPEGNLLPWDSACPCIEQLGDFGAVRLESAFSANVWADVPAGLWTRVSAENQSPGQSETTEFCDAAVALDEYILDTSVGTESSRRPWVNRGTANYPGEWAPNGAGYAIQATVGTCSPVTHTDSPGDFLGTGRGSEQESEERGNIQVGTGIITQSCADLIP